MLLERGPRDYMDTLAHCKSKLDIKRIAPGHGPMGEPEAIDHLINYLWWLLREVDEAIRLGLTRDAAIEAITLPKRFLISRFSPGQDIQAMEVPDQRIDSRRGFLLAIEGPQSRDHVHGAVAIAKNPPHGFACAFHIRWIAIQHPETRTDVGNDARERLVDLVGDRSC